MKKPNNRNVSRRCPSCGETKDAAHFGENRGRPDGLSCYCLECARAKSRAYYAARRRSAGAELLERDPSPEGFKRCSRCRVSKPLEEFHRHATQSRGVNTYCKECRRAIQADTHLRRTYGLSAADLAALLDEQRGVCAICETRPAVHVDHDHLSGDVRGVLCFPCNVALGQLKDDVALFRKAIDYLERTTWQRTLVSPGVYQLTSPRRAAAASATS